MAGLAIWLCCVEAGSELWFRGREQRIAVAPKWAINWSTGNQWKEIAIPKAAEDLLRYNEGRAAAWDDQRGRRWNLFFFKWLPGQTAALSVKVHRPEICLPASGFTSLGEPRSELIHVNDVALPTRAYRFRQGSTPVYVYYCYWDGTVFRNTEEMIAEDWTPRGRIHRAIEGRRDRGAQTLEAAIWGSGDQADADAAFKDELQRWLHASG